MFSRAKLLMKCTINYVQFLIEMLSNGKCPRTNSFFTFKFGVSKEVLPDVSLS